jgi:hypothetical protein
VFWLFVLMAGEYDHHHAENGSPSPKPMMLHAITSHTENGCPSLTIFYDSAFLEKSQNKVDKNKKNELPCPTVRSIYILTKGAQLALPTDIFGLTMHGLKF